MLIHLDQRFFTDDLRERASEAAPQAAAALQAIKDKSCVGAAFTGWYDYPRRHGFALATEIAAMVSSLPFHYDLVVVIGIGGSYLGTRALHEALSHSHHGIFEQPENEGRRPVVVYAGHTLAESALIHLLDLLDAREPVITVVSKSGTTIEPGIAFRVLRRYMDQRFGAAEAAKRVIAITDPEQGALRQMATDLELKAFAIPPDLGGRFSVFSPVGLVPLALAGHDIQAILEGADAVFADINANPNGHPALEYAAARMAAFKAGKAIEILAYSEPRLSFFVEWFKQLFGESEGKDGKGMLPAGLSLTTDLHSLGQWVQDGPRNVMETFLRFEDSGAFSSHDVERRLRVPRSRDNIDELGFVENRFINEINLEAARGTRIAHADGGVPGLELSCGRLNERTLGGLMAFFQVACGVSAALLQVNPYDQPGVESYKKNLFGLVGKPGQEHIGAAVRQRLSSNVNS